MATLTDQIRAQLEESARVKTSFSNELIQRMASFAEKSAAALRDGGKIVFFGNGGSASDAIHLAAELVVRLRATRPGLPSRGAFIVAFAGESGGALANKAD